MKTRSSNHQKKLCGDENGNKSDSTCLHVEHLMDNNVVIIKPLFTSLNATVEKAQHDHAATAY